MDESEKRARRQIDLNVAAARAVKEALKSPEDFDDMLDGPPSSASATFHGWRDEAGNLRFDWNDKKLGELLDRVAMETRGAIFEGADKEELARLVSGSLARAFTMAMRLDGVSFG